MKLTHYLLILLITLPGITFGQGSDFVMENLNNVSGTRMVEPERRLPVSSAVQVYSDGKYLSVAIKVIDPSINNDPNPGYADRVDVCLALPQYAFPQNFQYAFHPRILSGPAKSTRSYEDEPNRLFTVDESYSGELSIQNFIDNFGYPAGKDIYRQNLNLPMPQQVKEILLPIGMVKFSFFRDGRPPRNTDKHLLRNLEDHMGRRFSSLTDGIRYTAEPTEKGDGYILNIEFSIEAFGFIPLPRMEGVNLMVDVLNAVPGQRSQVVNSTSSMRSIHPLSFEYIQFRQPIKTNYTDLSDELFDKAGFYPVIWYTENDWDGLGVDVDALILNRNMLSKELLEVKLYEQSLSFNHFTYNNLEIDVLQAWVEYVNRVPVEKEFILANGHTIVAERARVNTRRPHSLIEDRWFTFPDGTLGLIYKESITQDPFGWGKCGDCLLETINISRIAEADVWDILEVEQADGDKGYCKIDNLYYEDFYVSNFDWVEEGSSLVLRLRHRNSKEKKRVQVSWDEYGTSLEVEEI